MRLRREAMEPERASREGSDWGDPGLVMVSLGVEGM